MINGLHVFMRGCGGVCMNLEEVEKAVSCEWLGEVKVSVGSSWYQ